MPVKPNYTSWRRQYYQWFRNSSEALGIILLLSTIVLLHIINIPELTRISLIHYTVLFCWGWWLWTLAEYIFHRFLFHFKSRHKLLRFLQFVLHGVHHSHPADTLIIPAVFRAVILFKTASSSAFLCLEFTLLSHRATYGV